MPSTARWRSSMPAGTRPRKGGIHQGLRGARGIDSVILGDARYTSSAIVRARVLDKLRLPLCRAQKEPGLVRILLGERHLRKGVKKQPDHYHFE